MQSLDYCKNANELKKIRKYNTNPRYSNFYQTYFTAGDEEQFHLPPTTINGKKSHSSDFTKSYNSLDIMNTFRYLFYKFKKGLFVRIKDNKLNIFLPFSNANFVNEWGSRMRSEIPFNELFTLTDKKMGYNLPLFKTQMDPSRWYSNNYLLRSENPINEGDTGIGVIHDMLNELCENRKVPDIEFFVNRRDFPIIKKDLTEPYDSIFDSHNFPLLSHKYERYAPILSMVTNENFNDVPIPTTDDWERVNPTRIFENKSFSFEFNTPFKNKKDIAVFRGSSTGEGTSISSNPRIKLAYLSSLKRKDIKGRLYLDCGITKWNTRPRKEYGKKNISFIDPNKIGITLVSFLSPKDQANCKYIINVDGHVTAFRLSLELSMGSVLLWVKSRYELWYTKNLKPFVHYVPIKQDLSDLYKKIDWCRKNEKKCEKIVKNAKQFYEKNLNKERILDYMQNTLVKLSKDIGGYSYPKKEEKIKVKRTIKYNTPIRSYEIYNHLRINEENKEIIWKSRNTKIYANKNFVFKSNQNIIHEYNIGIVINKLLKYIPNFVYTFECEKNEVILERIEGISFMDWLGSNEFNIADYICILREIMLSLSLLYTKTGLVHYDLFPWNIILNFGYRRILYPLEKVYKIENKIHPIIIDFGRTRKSDEICVDWLSILLSSLSIICSRRLNSFEIKEVLRISNFITGTEYRRERFENIGELKTFVDFHRKYSVVIYENKWELKNRSPLDLYKYLRKEETVEKYEFPLDYCFERPKNNKRLIRNYEATTGKKY